VSSHKRLAHRKDHVGKPAATEHGVKTILEIYDSLSSEEKKRVLAQLANAEQEPS
jgi:hypothetical protein